MTNSTTIIRTVKLLSCEKYKIISTGHKGLYWGVEVWLLTLTYANIYNILTVYSTPLHISAVHITQRSLPTNSGVKFLLKNENNYCENECKRQLPGTIQCIGSNKKLECKMKQNKTRQNKTISRSKTISRPCTAMQYRAQ